MRCDDIRESLELYVLGVLDRDEHARVELHLAECHDCQHVVQELSAIADTLPQALAAASPMRLAPSVKRRLVQALTAAPAAPLPADGHERKAARDVTSRVPEEGFLSSDGPQDAARDRRPAWRWTARWRWRTVGVLTVMFMLVLFLIWSMQLSAALAQERALRAEFVQLMRHQQEVIIEVIDSDKTVKAVLRPPDSTSIAYGKLFTRPDLPYVVIMAARLPPLPPGHAYHVWLSRGGQTELAGVLSLNQGFGLLILTTDQDGPVYDAAQITLQPTGSTTPADTPILLWEASH